MYDRTPFLSGPTISDHKTWLDKFADWLTSDQIMVDKITSKMLIDCFYYLKHE
jgi:hypothetical protein|tara:strand:+ start:268 stop:426 length:159 start_codon:yes stop_codon:yes gene_type:complete